MTSLHDVLQAHVSNGSVPGAVGLLARGDEIEVAAVGSASVGGVPMASDSIFRIASITKQIKLGNVARYRQALASALTGLERHATDSAPVSP